MTIRCARRRGRGVSHNSVAVVLAVVDNHRKSDRGRGPKPVGRFANTPSRRREWMCNSYCEKISSQYGRAQREMLILFWMNKNAVPYSRYNITTFTNAVVNQLYYDK